jgi:endo-1,4-beta-xylanase
MLMNRRQLLYLAAGLVVAPAQASLTQHPSTLKDLASAKGIIYGVESNAWDLAADPEMANAIVQQCAMLVDGSLKWDITRATPDRFTFDLPDWRAQFAQEKGLQLRGHNLVWHTNLPQWVLEKANPQTVDRILIEHIQMIVRRYAGKMHSWDVVNEAIEPEDGRRDGLRRSPWFELMGEDYIGLAFQVAAEADPAAMLVYNDYGIEYGNADHEQRRVAVLQLLERQLSKGTPIHALGIQSHLIGDRTDFDARKFQRFLATVADLGLKILITELDVIDQNLPANIRQRDRQVAQIYQEYLSAALAEPAVIAVLQWGLSDRYTWLSEFFPRPDGRPVRPLPLDQRLRPKLAWEAIGRAFEQAPRR